MFFGWVVVLVAFAIATFGWGLGFYGLGIYLVELHRHHGWPIAFISSAITGYYIVGGVLVMYLGDFFARWGPRRTVLVAVGAMGAGVLGVAAATRPWQLYVALGAMAVGWAGMSGAAVNAIVAPWFERRRGMAVSLAMNGASAGGVLLVPLWTVLISRLGFAHAALVVVGLMLALLWPFVALCLHRGPEAIGLGPDGLRTPGAAAAGSVPPAPRAAEATSRAALLRSGHFWTVAGTFAFALLAQVGFLTHQLTFLSPTLGLERAALAVSLTTIAAIVGRVGTGLFIDRVDRRVATACNLAVQTVALAAMLAWPSPAMLFIGSALYGLGVGNMVTFPSLLVQVEYPKESFNQVVGLVLAINQFTFAFGPGILGWARDRWGSYDAALLICIAWELAAAAVVLLGARGARRAAAYC
jgi:MFS family permease